MTSDPLRSSSRVGALKILGLPEVLKRPPHTKEVKVQVQPTFLPCVSRQLLLGLGWQLRGPHECTGKNEVHLTYVVPSDSTRKWGVKGAQGFQCELGHVLQGPLTCRKPQSGASTRADMTRNFRRKVTDMTTWKRNNGTRAVHTKVWTRGKPADSNTHGRQRPHRRNHESTLQNNRKTHTPQEENSAAEHEGENWKRTSFILDRLPLAPGMETAAGAGDHR